MDIKADKSRHKFETDHTFVDALYVTFSSAFVVSQVQQYIYSKNHKYIPRVLEVGCYNGRMKQFLNQNKIETDYIGIDIREDYLKNSDASKLDGCKLLLGDFTKEILVPDSYIDLCVSTEVFEHLTDREWPKAISDISKKLIIGGWLVIGMPVNTKDIKFHSPENEVIYGHTNFIIHEQLISVCREKGLKLIKYYNGITTRSSFELNDQEKNSKIYTHLKDMLGERVAKATMMSLSDRPTGGGYYVFEKINDTVYNAMLQTSPFSK